MCNCLVYQTIATKRRSVIYRRVCSVLFSLCFRRFYSVRRAIDDFDGCARFFTPEIHLKSVSTFKKRKEKGRVYLENIHYVEGVQLSNVDESRSHSFCFPFQIGYQESGQDYNLYLYAPRAQDRTEWILVLRRGEFLNSELETDGRCVRQLGFLAVIPLTFPSCSWFNYLCAQLMDALTQDVYHVVFFQ